MLDVPDLCEEVTGGAHFARAASAHESASKFIEDVKAYGKDHPTRSSSLVKFCWRPLLPEPVNDVRVWVEANCHAQQGSAAGTISSEDWLRRDAAELVSPSRASTPA
jgi:hypothetical protein